MKTRTVIGKVLVLSLIVGLLVATGTFAAEKAITGMVDQNDSGMLIISADDGEDYLLMGGNLVDMIGKTVKVTGTLSEEADAKTITVMEIEEISD